MVKLNINVPEDYFKDTEIVYNDKGDKYTVSCEMKKIWAIEIDLLKELERVCEKLGIRYFADAGTLLGAIRHKGFIPWDDDIDVIMTRNDYDVLLKNSSEFKEPYFLQTSFTDNYFDSGIKLRRSDTTGIINQDRYLKINQGIFIDIFVVDEIPDDKKECKKFLKKLSKYSIYGVYFFYYCRKFISYFFKKDFLNTKRQQKKQLKRYAKLNNYCKKYNNKGNKYCSCLMFVYEYNKHKHNFLNSSFEKPIKTPFEFTEIYISPDAHDILRMEYGETYMIPQMLPAYHNNVTFNSEKSYKEIKK